MIIVDDRTYGQRVRDQRQVDHGVDVAVGIPVGRVAVARVGIALCGVEFRFVGDVAEHAGLGTGAEQRALGAFEHFDALQIRGINI
jgi:hypothetical protein